MGWRLLGRTVRRLLRVVWRVVWWVVRRWATEVREMREAVVGRMGVVPVRVVSPVSVVGRMWEMRLAELGPSPMRRLWTSIRTMTATRHMFVDGHGCALNLFKDGRDVAFETVAALDGHVLPTENLPDVLLLRRDAPLQAGHELSQVFELLQLGLEVAPFSIGHRGHICLGHQGRGATDVEDARGTSLLKPNTKPHIVDGFSVDAAHIERHQELPRLPIVGHACEGPGCFKGSAILSGQLAIALLRESLFIDRHTGHGTWFCRLQDVEAESLPPQLVLRSSIL